MEKKKEKENNQGLPKHIILNKVHGLIDSHETLFRQRKLFLFNQIGQVSVEELILDLLTLDAINHDPITLYINSPGGAVDDGFALIDTMTTLKSKVITVAIGCVASMGTLVFIAGKERHCYENSIFMWHDMFAGVVDYSAKMKSRVDFLEREWNMIENHIKKYTKLSKDELNTMRSGELWLFAQEALKKGCVDKIL